VVFWGDGSAQREFLHVDDMAAACLFLLMHPETGYGDVYNAGSGENISIKKLSDMLVNITSYTGNITWDTEKPNGTPNRPLDSSKIRNLGWTPKIKLNDGLQNTYEWYLQNTNNIRTI
jgi:GDP-L-fucose synthase